MKSDVRIQDAGSIVVFYPLTKRARAWWAENVSEGPAWCGGFAVEHRYAADIAAGMEAEGMVIS